MSRREKTTEEDADEGVRDVEINVWREKIQTPRRRATQEEEQAEDRSHERKGEGEGGGGGATVGEGQAPLCEMSGLFNSLEGSDYGAAVNVIVWVRDSTVLERN